MRLMFQKANSDLDYTQYKLEYEMKTNYPDLAGKKNPELLAIKSQYKTLHPCFKPITAKQKETKNYVCATQTDLELSPWTKEEKTAEEQLKSHRSDL
ncbi:unnamed protein product [Nyctereutes procyonoides]|uniref:Protein FAM33A n=1 Tax=Nyctereutes procyonoides TaxID=34880 RepID=A0A811ZXA5_NYCPR|nr:unnamed protein product [Nyctereutes procyonoides]